MTNESSKVRVTLLIQSYLFGGSFFLFARVCVLLGTQFFNDEKNFIADLDYDGNRIAGADHDA